MLYDLTNQYDIPGVETWTVGGARIWAETVSFAVSAAAITPTPAVAASPSVTFSIVNALIAVFDGDGSTDLGGYLKQWLTWLPFPWRFFFKKP